MKYFNFFLAIPLSFYSPALYRQVGKMWRGRSFLYMLILLAICWVFIAWVNTHIICRTISSLTDTVIAQMPVIHFKNGIASIKQTEPVYIKVDNSVFAIIAPQDNFDINQSEATLFVKKDGVIVKVGGGQVKTYSFDKTLNISFGAQELKNFVVHIKNLTLPIIFLGLYLSGIVFSYIFYVIVSLLLGGLSKILALILKKDLTYAGAISISLILLTPIIILATVLDIAQIYLPYRYLIYFLISLGYLIYVVRILPRKHIENKI